jgi:acetylornithine deacetylase
MLLNNLKNESVELLKTLVNTPSISKEEGDTADIIEKYFLTKGYTPNRFMNNVWVMSSNFDTSKKTLLLNSHHDTVKPVDGWTYQPFVATCEDGKITGLGTNDAGASLVSLIATFLYIDQIPDRNFNLVFAASAEEEVSGQNGMEKLLQHLPAIDVAIVGEPTKMEMAIAEKGLLVLDCVARGKAGHAARNEGINAIYNAIDDITWFKTFRFPRVSDLLGEVKMTVTVIQAGKQHNIVPDSCHYTVDVRVNECYSNEEVYEIVKQHVSSDITPRSFRLNSSRIELSHKLVQKGLELGLPHYGSPTMSDQVFMNFPSLKLGPGDSARSHTANEFIFEHEIKEGIDIYCKLLATLEL